MYKFTQHFFIGKRIICIFALQNFRGLFTMQLKISAPADIHTKIQLPASKSLSNRALLIQALSEVYMPLHNLSNCDDTRIMQNGLVNKNDTINIQAAGTAMRFLTAYYAIQPDSVKILTGTARMMQRPVKILVDALTQLGADIEYMGTEGFPPLKIRGKELNGGELHLPANVSSQYISALMMIAPKLKGGLTLHLEDAILSRPYIDMTMEVMKAFGGIVEWVDNDTIRVKDKPYLGCEYTIENDWSAASYWYEIASLIPDATLELPGLKAKSTQGDSSIVKMFRQLGIKTSFTHNGAYLTQRFKKLKRLTCDFANEPDLTQTFVATCCFLDIPFRFSGLSSLKIKETNRIYALITELGKLGYQLSEENEGMLAWYGKQHMVEGCPVINTYEDHRMAMSLAPACIRCGHVIINDAEVVSKSYPDFWNEMKRAGFTVKDISK